MMISDIFNLAKYFSRDSSTRNWVFAFSIFLFVLLLIVIVEIYVSIYEASLEDNVSVGKKLLISQEVKKDLLANYGSYSARVEHIYSEMSKTWSQPDLVREIERLAKSSRVEVRGQNYRQTGTQGRVDTYVVDISAIGHYPSVKKFVQGLTEIRGRAVIEYLKLSNNNDRRGVSLSIKLKVFHLKS